MDLQLLQSIILHFGSSVTFRRIARRILKNVITEKRRIKPEHGLINCNDQLVYSELLFEM